MSNQPSDLSPQDCLGGEELQSARFAQLVLQLSNLALMLLGKVPHPERGQAMRDLEGAQLFIDQLEMLEAKTKGNLNPQEAALLKQTLMTLRLAFVEAANTPAPGPSSPAPDATAKAPKEETPPGTEAEEGPAPKRFSKKFS